MSIRVENLRKHFRGVAAVDDVSFTIEPGSLVALLGPSGSGKSTILRVLAGLETPDAGTVWLDGVDATRTHARRRAIGFVFQHYALFRHLTVADNVGFGLRVRHAPQAEVTRRVDELLDMVGLGGLGQRYPSQLSGGQRQRVALARALAPEPRLLLLDEPFGAVDAKVREELRQWLRRLHDDLHVTSVFVTHDQDEAFAIADQVLVLDRGRLEQQGSPTDILDRPATEFVARFVGEANVFDAMSDGTTAAAGALSCALHNAAPPGRVRLVVRSYDVKIWREDEGNARVERIVTLGDRVRVQVVVDGAGPLVGQFPRRSSLLRGLAAGGRARVEITLARGYAAEEPPGHAGAVAGRGGGLTSAAASSWSVSAPWLAPWRWLRQREPSAP